MERTREQRKRGFQQLVSFQLGILTRLSDRHADLDYQRKLGLSLLQCRVLGIVGSHGEMTFKNVCRDTGIEKSHASRIVTSLVEAGLFSKTSDPNDQRSIILRPTVRGKKMHEQVLTVATDRNTRWLAPLSKEQSEVFLDCVELLTQQARKLSARTLSPAHTRGRRRAFEPAQSGRAKARPRQLQSRNSG